MILQPCDWQEHDYKYKYVVDVFGRTIEDTVARVRLTGFSPYFYIKYDENLSNSDLLLKLSKESNRLNANYNSRPVDFKDIQVKLELKLDVMNGFNGLKPIKVWRLICPNLKTFKSAGRAADSLKLTTYETDLPPYIRLFHELDLSPASPISFDGDEKEVEDDLNVDLCYEVNYKVVKPSID